MATRRTPAVRENAPLGVVPPPELLDLFQRFGMEATLEILRIWKAEHRGDFIYSTVALVTAQEIAGRLNEPAEFVLEASNSQGVCALTMADQTVFQTRFTAREEPGGVGDPGTVLSLMWMFRRADGSVDPSQLVVSVNESLKPLFLVESKTALPVTMYQAKSEPRAT